MPQSVAQTNANVYLPDHDGGFPSCGVVDDNALQAL